MKKFRIVSIFLILSLIISFVTVCYSWGFFAHKRINHLAVFTLPPEMIGYFKSHIEHVTDHAVDPDKRRNVVAEEAARHYIDIDHYGAHPFDTVPHRWKDAVAKFTEDTLKAYGILPWHISLMMFRLTDAFREKDSDEILKLCSDLGHYIADANVPLHTTENYNGQMTGQNGIHAFWESRLPELFGDEYDYFVGRAFYIKDPLEMAWNMVKESNAALDSVLKFEKQLNDKFSPDKKYSFEAKGNTTAKVYSHEYSEAYHKMLGGQVERRMRSAIIMVGSYWYTAWVNAGQPDLSTIEKKDLSDDAKKQLQQEEELFKKGKVLPAKGHTD